jgi:hypothetical protein
MEAGWVQVMQQKKVKINKAWISCEIRDNVHGEPPKMQGLLWESKKYVLQEFEALPLIAPGSSRRRTIKL